MRGPLDPSLSASSKGRRDIESERARKRQIELGKIHGKPPVETHPLASNEVEGGKTAEIIASKVQLSPRTFERAKIIIQKAPNH